MSGEETEAPSDEDVAADEPEPDAPASSEAANENAQLFDVWDVTGSPTRIPRRSAT